jgi:adenylate kinase family enzyme
VSKELCIVLVGPPCSGKSAVGKEVASKIRATYISSGDIARKMAEYDTQIDNDLTAGKMAPEDIMRDCIFNEIMFHLSLPFKSVFILDGFPRFGDQAKWLQHHFGSMLDIKYVLFDVPLSTIIERSAHRSRNDDKSLEQRLKYYYNITFQELCKYIDRYIDANDNNVNECSQLLIKYIKEVINIAKDCQTRQI